MKVLITGICGFVGSQLASALPEHLEGLEILGLDNLSRPGSEQNRMILRKSGRQIFHGDLRNPSDLESLPAVDWVIDAAANPSVLAGVSGGTSSRQVMEHNLGGTLQLLEYCRQHRAGFVMLSTSRVYALDRLCALPVEVREDACVPRFAEVTETGVSPAGVNEGFSTQPPLSLYGAAKLASELVILEYAHTFDLPVHINRCGVLAGAGQFGKPDQGIFAFWIHSYRYRRPLKYIGFGGTGHQVRDCLHPKDLAVLIAAQLRRAEGSREVLNVSGGMASSISLARLSRWCADRFGPHTVGAQTTARRFDVPWLVLDAGRAERVWGWRPAIKLEEILEELAQHAEQHPEWLDLSQAV